MTTPEAGLRRGLEAKGDAWIAEEVLSLAGGVERARQQRDCGQARAMMDALADVIYRQEN